MIDNINYTHLLGEYCPPGLFSGVPLNPASQVFRGARHYSHESFSGVRHQRGNQPIRYFLDHLW
jgi:hypothetical protein